MTTKFGVSKSTAWNCVKKFVQSLIKYKSLFIKWPSIENSMETSAVIEATYGFPEVIGFLDGTLVRIAAPKQDKQCYVDRKKNISMHQQVKMLKLITVNI